MRALWKTGKQENRKTGMENEYTSFSYGYCDTVDYNDVWERFGQIGQCKTIISAIQGRYIVLASIRTPLQCKRHWRTDSVQFSLKKIFLLIIAVKNSRNFTRRKTATFLRAGNPCKTPQFLDYKEIAKKYDTLISAAEGFSIALCLISEGKPLQYIRYLSNNE